jgi:hypothetical protein
MKSLARLLGNVVGLALSGFSKQTPAPRTNPTLTVEPGAKLISYGENITSVALNRAFSALGTNIDELDGLLSLNVPRQEVLRPLTDSDVSTGVFGFADLDLTDPTALLSGDSVVVDLGNDDGTVEPPAKWVYTGVQKRALENGGVMRLSRISSRAENGGTAEVPEAGYGKEIFVSDVFNNSAGASIYGTQTYLGVSPEGMPSRIPGLSYVSSSISPYGGSSLAAPVSSWHTDGLTLSTRTANELYLEPGVFVEVSGSASNDGIYAVRSFNGKRLSLSRGGLIKVTVASGTPFSTGSQVAWRSRPNHASSPTFDQCEHKAYVAWKDGTTLYLWGSFAPTDSGSAVSSKAHASLGSVQTRVGVRAEDFDAETDASVLNSLVVGTVLLGANYSSIATSTTSTVTAVTYSNYPVIFTDESVSGVTATPMNPIGFTLNPALVLADYDASPTRLMGGRYNLLCQTLVKLSDLMRPSSVAQDVLGQTPDRRVDYLNEPQRAFNRHLRFGNAEPEDYEDTLSGDGSPTRAVLGNTLWLLKGTQTADSGVGLGYPVASGDAAFDPGDVISITHPTAGYGATKAVVVTGWGEYLLVRDVSRDAWTNVRARTNFAVDSIAANSTFTDTATTQYTISDVYKPKILISNNGASATYIEAPPPGLNSAYHNYYGGYHGERNTAQGREIALKADKPLRIVVSADANQTSLDVYTDQTTTNLLTETTGSGVQVKLATTTTSLDGKKTLIFDATDDKYLFYRNSAAHFGIDASNSGYTALDTAGSVIALRNTSGTAKAALDFSTNALGFSDNNLGMFSSIYLSSSDFNYLPFDVPSVDPPSILATLHAALHGGEDYTSTANGVLSGGAVSTSTFDVNVAAVVFNWRSRRWPVASASSAATMPSNATRYLYYDFWALAYALSATIDPTDDTRIYLAKLVSDGSSVTKNIDIRCASNRASERADILVGAFTSGNTYSKAIAHFASIGEAFQAITAWRTATGGVRAYTIHVIGPVTEAENSTKNISFPMSLPCDGIEIVGHDDPRGNSATVTWSSEDFLFNVSASGFVVRGVRFRFSGTPTYGTSPTTGLFTCNVGNSTLCSALIEDVSLTSTSDVVETFFYSTSSTQGFWTDLTIRRCSCGIANSFFHVEGATNNYYSVTIDGNQFAASGSSQATNARAAIFSSSVSSVRVTGNDMTSEGSIYFSDGIRFTTSERGGIVIRGNRVSDAEHAGIALEHESSEPASAVGSDAHVSENFLNDCATSSGYSAIILGMETAVVEGNNIYGGGYKSGIEVFANNVLVRGNVLRNILGSGILVRDIQLGAYGYGAVSPRGVVIDGCVLEDLGSDDRSGDAGVLLKPAANNLYYPVIRNCSIDVNRAGNGAVRTNVNKAVLIDAAVNGARIEGCTVLGAFGVVLAGPGPRFSRNTMTNGPHGTARLCLLNVDSDDAVITDNDWQSLGSVYVAGVDSTKGQRLVFESNVVRGSDPSLSFGSSASINNASIRGNTLYGIGSAGVTCVLTRSVIADNILLGGKIKTLDGSSHNSITGNVLGTFPIEIGDSEFNTVIANNVGSGSGADLTIGDSCGRIKVTGNTFFGNVALGGSFSDGVVSGNTISGGNITLGASANTCVIQGNTLDNGAITLATGARIVVSGNTTGTGAINAQTSNTDLIIHGNTCGGINASGNHVCCVISDNHTLGGDILLGSGGTVCPGCEVRGNNTAVAGTPATVGGDITLCVANSSVSFNKTGGGAITLLNDTGVGTSATPLSPLSNSVVGNVTVQNDLSTAGEIHCYAGGNAFSSNVLKFGINAGNGAVIEIHGATTVSHYNTFVGNVTTGITNTTGTDVLSGNITA